MSAKELDEEGARAKRPNYPIESVDNALRLLLVLAEHGHIRVSEASSELGIAVSTAHRLLAMLQHHDFVVQDVESKMYKVGPVLLRLGLAAVRDLDIRTVVHPHVRTLRDEVRETVHVAIRQGQEVLFIDCAESPIALRVASRVGTSMWAHCTSIGKAWLAQESDAALRELYPSTKLPALTSRSITSRTKLLAELTEIRRRGFALNKGESEIGVGSVSSAIRARDGQPVAAISISVPLVRMSDERWTTLARAVGRTATVIESALP